jgi:signal transduction histidine kinase
MKSYNQSRSVFILAIELLLTLCVCIAIAFANLMLEQNQAAKYTQTTAEDYHNLTDRYLSVFKVLTVSVREKIASDPSFDEMQRWLMVHDDIFREAVDKDVYDGFAMTYKNGYAHSWNYGDYSKYDPNTRVWYQQAAKAGGQPVVVAPYLSFLGASKLKADQVVVMTIAQKYSDTISFDLDLKIKKLDAILSQYKTTYAGTSMMLFDKDGFILSSTNKAYYAHNVNEPDESLSKSLSSVLLSLQKNTDDVKFVRIDGQPYFAYASVDKEGNTYVALSPFWAIFIRRFLWIVAIFLVLAAIEIWIYYRQKHELNELSARDMRILQAMAIYFEGVYVGHIDKDEFEVLKADYYYEPLMKQKLTKKEIFAHMATERVAPEAQKEFLQDTATETIKARLDASQGFSTNVLMRDGHWRTMHFIRSEDYATSQTFVFFVENGDEEMRKREVLEDALETANKATAAKSEFLSRMSHEIRTPMNAIVGLNAIAKNHVTEPSKVEDYLNKIDASAKVLLNIINDVLDMSAIANNKLKIAKAEFDLKSVLNAISTIYYTQCEQKGIHFIMDVNLKDELLIGDSLRVNQILMNLVSNAFKFTDKGGTIAIRVKEDRREDDTVFLQFKVSDTGVGMGPEMIKRLFKPFEQESAGTAKKYGGSGLGLSICKNLVTLLHGNIVVESAKGKGTTFTVELPFKTTGRASEPVGKSEFKDPGLLANSGKESLRAVPLSNYDFSGHRALLAEDNAINSEVARELLHMAKLDCDLAFNGQEAVDKFNNSAPGTYDLILMDIQMPVLDGYGATKAIRALPRPDGKTIPIFAMTADAFTEDVSTALASGMNGHLAKPIDVAKLYATVASVIKK